MTVKMNRRFDSRFERFDQFKGIIRCQQPCHILYADTVRIEFFKFFGLVDIIVDVVDLSAHTRLGHAVAHATLKMFAALFDYRNNGLKVSIVIEGIKCTEDVHSIFAGSFHKRLGNIIGIVAIADQILTAQQHGKRRFFNVTLQRSNPFPGVLI